MLTHTTGPPNRRIPGRALKCLRLPGKNFSRSGEGFVYLQRVVEQLTGTPLDEFLREKLFGPLNMTSASLVCTAADYAKFVCPPLAPSKAADDVGTLTSWAAATATPQRTGAIA